MKRFIFALSSLSVAATAATVWDGVYSDPQASRGEAAYAKSCAACHGDKLGGTNQTPGLVGSEFLSTWEGMTLGDLFGQMQTTMPGDRPGQLSKSDNADILAYLMKVNRFPAGAQELPADAEKLKEIRIQSKP